MEKPKVAITLGDPAGIGPEIVLRAINSLAVQRVCSPIVLGDKYIIEKHFNINSSKASFQFTSDYKDTIHFGKPSKISGLIACDAIRAAVNLCMSKVTKSMITAPVSKESFKFAGLPYSGHTEFLAKLTKSKKYCMMMVCNSINSVMVTRHLPISEISKSLTKKDIITTTTLAANFIEQIDNKKPKIIICALNPHAGDNGILGLDEKETIIPAIKELNKIKFDISGPLPADIAWSKIIKKQYDLIVAMYHDQVMIPLKIIDYTNVVNVTAGLPFVRTSPGHGTAFDIAGQNKADPTSMIESILFAVKASKKYNYNKNK
ncbi:MAG: 4-hydroxythreonine-4-phosphate dehydrogenase PdxA [Endomicrobiaceae bacterium]|nr:4-hydroxythreonine-4-phosphate dehydrogenase PdxA [Endomicrobiaceae bacterium]